MRKARGGGVLADRVRADVRPAEPVADGSGRLEADARPAARRAGRVELGEYEPPGRSSRASRDSSAVGRPPMPMLPSSKSAVPHVPAPGMRSKTDA